MFPLTLPIQTSNPASERMNAKLSFTRLVSQLVEEPRRPCWRKKTGREELFCSGEKGTGYSLFSPFYVCLSVYACLSLSVCLCPFFCLGVSVSVCFCLSLSVITYWAGKGCKEFYAVARCSHHEL